MNRSPGLFGRRDPGFASALAIVLMCLGGAGCTRPEHRADLIIVNGAEPETLDPALMTGQADLRLGLALFEGLTRFNATHALPEPGLAQNWEISADGTRYRFELRPDAQWSTGEPITAEDVVYSWRRLVHPRTASEYAGVLFYVRQAEAFHRGALADADQLGFRAMGPREIEVELNHPTPFFLSLCALPALAVVPRQVIEAHGDRWLQCRPLPTSGAYELVDWRINDRVRLRKNRRYWDATRTRTERIDLLPSTSASTALNLYLAGEVDIVWDKNLVPVELLDLLLERPDFHTSPLLGTYFIRFNVTRPPFDDGRVRRALAMALDKSHLVRKITRGGETVPPAFTPPGIPDYTPPAGLPFDPARARDLLAEAGYPGGAGFPRFHYLFDTTTRVQEQIAVEIQAMWEQHLGLRPELRKMEWKTYLAAQGRLDYDVCRSSWIGDYNDPNTFLDLFMSHNGNNRTGWRHPPYDQLIAEANAQTAPEERARRLQAAERLLVVEEAPIIPLYVYAGLEYYDPAKVRGLFPNLLAEHPLRALEKVAP